MGMMNGIAFDTFDSFLSVYSMDSHMNYRERLWWQIIWNMSTGEKKNIFSIETWMNELSQNVDLYSWKDFRTVLRPTPELHNYIEPKASS